MQRKPTRLFWYRRRIMWSYDQYIYHFASIPDLCNSISIPTLHTDSDYIYQSLYFIIIYVLRRCDCEGLLLT